jgi:hypothetical protein
MVINIGNTSVSIPNRIADWVHQNDDNKTEFYGMIDSMMYAIKTFYKTKYEPTPYQEVYEEQLRLFLADGYTKEQADERIKFIINDIWHKS